MNTQNINISIFTTSLEEYKELLNKANSSKYVSKFSGFLWEWEGGAKLYKASVELLVNSRLSLLEEEATDFKGKQVVVPRGIIERYLRIKLKIESYTSSELKNNTGESKETIIDSFGRRDPEVIDLKPPQSLKNIDLSKKKSFSFKPIKATPKQEAQEFKKVDRPPTNEERDLKSLEIENPIVNTLVDKFSLSPDQKRERPQRIIKLIEDWSSRIEVVDIYFKTLKDTTGIIKLNKGANIRELKTFISAHIETVKANNGKRVFLPYLERLEQLREIILVNRVI